jgi:putative membrane protein
MLAAVCNTWGPGGWWPVFPLLWFVLIWGALFVFGARFRRRWAHQRPSAENTLADRYARGEIDATEYRDRLEVLKRESS